MARSTMQAHPTMPSRWRGLIERALPWWDAERERRRDEQTERIRVRSVDARLRAEHVIDAYRQAGLISGATVDRFIAEARHPK